MFAALYQNSLPPDFCFFFHFWHCLYLNFHFLWIFGRKNDFWGLKNRKIWKFGVLDIFSLYWLPWTLLKVSWVPKFCPRPMVHPILMVLGLYRPFLAWKWIEYWKAFCRVSFMPKCLFLRPQMEFLGSVKAPNHQNWMDLSQVNRPMGLGQNFQLFTINFYEELVSFYRRYSQ